MRRVQEVLGKAMIEGGDYRGGAAALKEMQRLEPFRLSGVETLSTALWHLKKDKELCALAHQVSIIGYMSVFRLSSSCCLSPPLYSCGAVCLGFRY